MPGQFIRVGRIKSTFGYNGILKVKFENINEEGLLNTEAFFFFSENTFIPYFTESIAKAGNSLYHIKFQDIESKEEAGKLTGQDIFLPEEETEIELPGEYLSLKGFMAFDKEAGPLGIIEEVLLLPMQEMARIDHNGIEVLIPLNDSTIESIDHTGHQVFFQLPDGLLEVYTGR